MEIIKPKKLAENQTIGIIAPSSPPRDSAVIPLWIERIRALGFQVKAGKHLYDRWGYLAGFDEDRAADINQMFADEDVDAIICLRSGYGSARTLPYFDYDLIRNNPKVIIGFSDLTALLNAIHAKTGLVTFHGPEAEDELILRPYSLAEFKKVVISGQSNITIGGPMTIDSPEADSPEADSLEADSLEAEGGVQNPKSVDPIGAGQGSWPPDWRQSTDAGRPVRDTLCA